MDLLAIEDVHALSPRLVNQLGLAIAHPVVDLYIKLLEIGPAHANLQSHVALLGIKIDDLHSKNVSATSALSNCS